jgi:molybdopterin-binding protein
MGIPAAQSYTPLSCIQRRIRMLSARNQFKGTILSVKTGTVMSEVIVDIGGGNHIVSLISATSAKRLKLKKGKPAVVVIKSTEVMISTGDE